MVGGRGRRPEEGEEDVVRASCSLVKREEEGRDAESEGGRGREEGERGEEEDEGVGFWAVKVISLTVLLD
jgi:hypothetical protein